MSTTTTTDTIPQVKVKREPASNPDPITGLEAFDPTVHLDYWRVNYMTRPYYKEGRSFGDYEAAYRYGLDSATTRGEKTFEEAEKALASGWTAARGGATFSWEDVRDATRDAWIHVRRGRKP